jgi:hypothetical protein
MTFGLKQEENMRKTIIALAILAPATAFAATKPAGCALLDEAACGANRACAWSPPMVRGEKSPTTGKPYKITRRGYCHRRPLRSSPHGELLKEMAEKGERQARC